MTTALASAARVPASGLASRAFVALCLIYFLNSFVISPFSSLFPVYVEADLGRLPWFTGYLRGLMLVLGGLFAVVGGRLCDVLGRKATLLIGLSGSLLTGLVFNTASPLLLTVLVFGLGAATGPWTTAGQSYLICAIDTRRLGLGGALYFLSNTAGSSLGSLATGLAKQHWSFGRLGHVMSASLVGIFLLALLLLPGGDGPARNGRSQGPLTLWAAYCPLFRRSEIHLLVGLRYMITSFWGMATLLLPLLIYRVCQAQVRPDAESVPAYFAAVSLAAAAGCQLLTGVLCDRFGRLWPLVISAAGICVSAVGLASLWDSLPWLFVCGTSLTGTAWAVSTLVPKLISDVAEPDEKNRLVGLGHLVWSAAMVSGSLAGGILVEVHPAVPFGAGAALAAGGTACAWRLCQRLEGRGR
ncbi:MAG: MFS transporter [Candidatus Latescibacterota bacterium]